MNTWKIPLAYIYLATFLLSPEANLLPRVFSQDPGNEVGCEGADCQDDKLLKSTVATVHAVSVVLFNTKSSLVFCG